MTESNDILLVDDKPENLQVLSDMLLYSGYTVRGVTNAKMALRTIAHSPPQLILMDIMMPGSMDGYELCRRIKADEATRDIPVIFISALDATLDKVRAFDVGGVDYITKPFQLEEVLARVETHLRLRYQQQEIEQLREEEHRYYERLSEVQQDLLRSTAHDLKNPLTVIMSYTYLLADSEPIRQDEQLHEYTQRVLQSSRQMQRLLTELLEIAQLETGNSLSLEVADPIFFFAEYVNPFQASAAKKDIRFDVDILPDVPLVRIDKPKMGRAISNLIINAIKYTPRGGEVRVWMEANPAGVFRMGVTDNGAGIPADELDRVFDKFYRVANDAHRQEPGTGLGLAIVQTVVRQHGGEVYVQSEVGRGSTFTIELPTVNADEAD